MTMTMTMTTNEASPNSVPPTLSATARVADAILRDTLEQLEALARGTRPPLDEFERECVVELLRTCNDLRYFAWSHEAPTPPDCYAMEADAWLARLHGRFPA